MVIMMGLVVLAAFVLVPTIGTYVDQRQQIAALQAAVEVSREDVADLEAQRDRWTDPAYITTQARPTTQEQAITAWSKTSSTTPIRRPFAQTRC